MWSRNLTGNEHNSSVPIDCVGNLANIVPDSCSNTFYVFVSRIKNQVTIKSGMKIQNKIKITGHRNPSQESRHWNFNKCLNLEPILLLFHKMYDKVTVTATWAACSL